MKGRQAKAVARQRKLLRNKNEAIEQPEKINKGQREETDERVLSLDVLIAERRWSNSEAPLMQRILAPRKAQ